jgi:hypothetical protein
MMSDRTPVGQHFSQVVAPVLAAFTLPTIALVVAMPPSSWRNVILFLFVASTGLLLASFQLAVGSLFRDTTGWGAVRAFLGGLGLILLMLGLIFLVWLRNGGVLRDFLIAGSIFLAAGVLVPIGMTIWLKAEYTWTTLGRTRFGLAEYMRTKRGRLLTPATRSEYRPPSEDDARRVFSRGGDYYRIRALRLMREYPGAGSVDCIVYSICQSRSAFEESEAVAAALQLPDAKRRAIRAKVWSQRGFDGLVELPKRDCDRTEQLLAMLRASAPTP